MVLHAAARARRLPSERFSLRFAPNGNFGSRFAWCLRAVERGGTVSTLADHAGAAHLQSHFIQHHALGIGYLHHMPPGPRQPLGRCTPRKGLAVHEPAQARPVCSEVHALAEQARGYQLAVAWGSNDGPELVCSLFKGDLS